MSQKKDGTKSPGLASAWPPDLSKDPALALQQLTLLLWPWPGSFHMLRARAKKKKTKKTEHLADWMLSTFIMLAAFRDMNVSLGYFHLAVSPLPLTLAFQPQPSPLSGRLSLQEKNQPSYQM